MDNGIEGGAFFGINKIAPMTEEEFKRIVFYMQNNYGIELKDKKTIVTGRLDNHVGTLGHTSYTEVMNAVERNPKGKEAMLLVDMLTTNYTYFMREFEHFEFWKDKVLPELRQREERTRDIRVWCGAASTGEEPYTIAMMLSDYFGSDEGWDTGILATDISVKALETAVRGVYPKDRVVTLPYGWRERYFRPVDKDYLQVIPELRKKVTYSTLNLMDTFPFRKKMHTIFMRNVMIYFDNKTRLELLGRLYDVLEPGGYLFIGMTENVDKNRTGFEYVRPAVYRKPLR